MTIIDTIENRILSLAEDGTKVTHILMDTRDRMALITEMNIEMKQLHCLSVEGVEGIDTPEVERLESITCKIIDVWDDDLKGKITFLKEIKTEEIK